MLAIAKDFNHVIINTSTPSLKKRLQSCRSNQGAAARHKNRFCRRAHNGFADGNFEGVAGD